MARVLLISLDVVGQSMAGPAIRYFEFAKALACAHEVVLMTPKLPDIAAEKFRWAPFSAMKEEIKHADVVVCQQLKIKMAFWLWLYRPRLIVDAYDPQPLEHLEIFKAFPLTQRSRKNEHIVALTRFSMLSADGILCANGPQRDLWLGLMMGQAAITPKIYDRGPSLSHWLALVPFGLPEKPMAPLTGMREKFGLAKEDIILLWGGGIWNWFDPLTLIRAVALLSGRRTDIKLVFMGIKHPNDQVPEMRMAQEAVELAKSLGLLGKQIFFNFDWTPYEARQAFLNEADIGVSTHFDHLETRYAFRTRMLDYLWAGLPIISTRGDSFAELIEKEGAGIAVEFEDPEALAWAIEKIALQPESYRKNSKTLSQAFTWPQVIKPLEEMIQSLAPRKAKGVSLAALFKIVGKTLQCR